MTHWRPPAVAGTFYPSDPHRLAEQLDRLLSTAEVASTHPPKALIVPHAGHIYSGPMADSGAIFVCATASCTKASAAPGFVRQRLDGAMHPTTYGRSSGFCIDLIEKKPLNHFFRVAASCPSVPPTATCAVSFAKTGYFLLQGHAIGVLQMKAVLWSIARRFSMSLGFSIATAWLFLAMESSLCGTGSGSGSTGGGSAVGMLALAISFGVFLTIFLLTTMIDVSRRLGVVRWQLTAKREVTIAAVISIVALILLGLMVSKNGG